MKSHHVRNPELGKRYYALVKSTKLETTREKEYDYSIIRGVASAKGLMLKDGTKDEHEPFVEIAGQRVRLDCVYNDVRTLVVDVNATHAAIEHARAVKEQLPQPAE